MSNENGKKEIISVLYDAQAIDKRLDEIAKEIENDYAGEKITLVCILRGGVVFMVDLAKKIQNITVEFDFMDVSSYGNETVSSGIVKVNKDLSQPITGKNVIIVEDIIDTGNTMSHLKNHFVSQKPKSLKLCSLLDKAERRIAKDVTIDYIGFSIPDEFVVGYGLDYAQKYRNLSYIGILKFEE